MQMLYCYSIFDNKANAYLQPFFSINADTARREFHKAVNGDGQFNRWAEDYSLFQMGCFDQDDGTWEMHSAPKHIVNAVTLKEITSELQEAVHHPNNVPYEVTK